MNYKIILSSICLFFVFSCKKQENQIIKQDLIGEWLINDFSYTLKYDDSIQIVSPDERISLEALVYFNEEGTYQKEDPEKILVLGGGLLSRTGIGSWNSVNETDSLYLDRLEYYDFTSATGNRYKIYNSEESKRLISNGITTERDGIKDNVSDLLQNFKPFINLGNINGNTEVNLKDNSNYDEGYYQGLYIGYCTGFLNNLVDQNDQLKLDRNPYSYYLYHYLVATQAIWSNSTIKNAYEQGYADGFASNKGQNKGKEDFLIQKGKICTVIEDYTLSKK